MLSRSNSTTTATQHNSTGVNRGLVENLNDNGGFTTPPDAANMASIKKIDPTFDDDAIGAALLQCGNNVERAVDLLYKDRELTSENKKKK
jgi:hypothetical protein